MTVKQIIPADAYKSRSTGNKSEDVLRISEFFYDTIQGEGIHVGHPAAFMRLQGCTLNCTFCDSTSVWKYGSPYTFDEIFELMDIHFIAKLSAGQHLVITGGSPLMQQEKLTLFLIKFLDIYKFLPYIEIENECVLMPNELQLYVDCWNNSPKLSNSGVAFDKRYEPEVIKYMSKLPNSWFKFVISKEDDWNEIEAGFLMPRLIKREQIILMPEGATKAELERNRIFALEMAIEQNVRFTDRLHITVWDKKVGV